MSDITHLRNSPYDKTKKEFGLWKPISYELAIDDESPLDPDTVKEYINLQKEVFTMADFNKGQTFLDKSATNYQGTKGKYFIALSDADDDDDPVICFVMNTEHRMSQAFF